MTQSLRLGRVAGIVVGAQWSALAIVALIAVPLSDRNRRSPEDSAADLLSLAPRTAHRREIGGLVTIDARVVRPGPLTDRIDLEWG